MRLLTNDLYEGAWLLSKGMNLANLWMEPGGRRSVVFEFEGDSIEGLKEEYKRGKASANVYQLKVAMSELRDRMYALLREKSQIPSETSPSGGPSPGGNGNGLDSGFRRNDKRNGLPGQKPMHLGGYRLRKEGQYVRSQEVLRQ